MPELWGRGIQGRGTEGKVMGRLRRFPTHRYVGRRDQMLAYDCDDKAQFEALAAAVEEFHLDMRNHLQSFAPDTAAEAHNRCFRTIDAAPAKQG
jgi:hypothetical protein